MYMENMCCCRYPFSAVRFRVHACFSADLEGCACALLLVLLPLVLLRRVGEHTELEVQSTATRPAALASQRFQSSS